MFILKKDLKKQKLIPPKNDVIDETNSVHLCDFPGNPDKK